ncbi:MAG: Uma2 family endonuclease [Desulfatirhabdiaceae bacterium]
MTQALEKNELFTKEEYLEMEERNEFRSEYFAGEIFAMAGGSPDHSTICFNMIGELRDPLRRKRCRGFESNMKLEISQADAIVYPDVMVICDKIERTDHRSDVIKNPILIVEVLSPSTESFDRGKKFEYYRTLPSLQEYVMISQDAPLVEAYHKQDDRNWLFSVSSGREETVVLQSLECEIRLTDIYQHVEFSQPPKTGGPHEPGGTD